MDASQWPQHHQIGGLGRTMEEIQAPNNIMNTNMSTITTNSSTNSMVERKVRPQNKDQVVNCPRCNSTNTKFCYYNNYSLAQPRYFCKTCRRYWTHGGSLRNVPVGGGSRKNKRSSPSILANPSSTPSKINPNLNPPNTFPHLMSTTTTTTTTTTTNNNNNNNNNNKLLFLDAHDLNLAFPMQGNISNSTPMASRGSLSSYIPMSMPDPNSPLYPSGLPNLQEFKGVFSSSHGGDNGNNNDNSNNGARLLFPFADMNKLASSVKSAHHEHDPHDQSKGDDHDHQHQHHDHHDQGPTGYYWSGMLGGGTW